MNLFYFPGASSLAAHIALREAGFAPDLTHVDVFTGQLRDGGDFRAISPKGYVPVLQFDTGALLTETIAILDWAAGLTPHLRPTDDAARTRLLQDLAFISTEIQKPMVFIFTLPDEASRGVLLELVGRRFEILAGRLAQSDLLAQTFSVADILLYVMVRWAEVASMELPAAFADYKRRIEARPAVRDALAAEGLLEALAVA